MSYIFCVHITKYCMLVNDINSLIQTFFLVVFRMVRNVFNFGMMSNTSILNYSIGCKAIM